jgi:alkylation response protein AidB-like acyl-CoA dehydrogenase
MDFSRSPEQLALKADMAAFGHSALGLDLPRRDRDEIFDVPGWKSAAAIGLAGLTVPIHHGGSGHDALTAALLLEGLGHGCRDNGFLMSLGAHLWGCAQPIVVCGSQAQQERFLPKLANGAWLGALAVTEAQAGSDVAAIRTTARRESNTYVLDGNKILVTNAPLANIFLVLASTEPHRGSLGLSCFVLERETPGLTTGPNETKMGLRTAPIGGIDLKACHVPEENRLGPEGAGLAIFNAAMAWERNLILAPALGTMQRLLEISCTQARSRHQFGKRIGDFQHISCKLVDMEMRLEASRALLHKAAWLKTVGRPNDRESALAKLATSEAWVACCEHALQIHGGRGYLAATEVERELRDALGSRLYSGTTELLTAMLSRRLLAK